MSTNFQLYLSSIDEYKRFADNLPITKTTSFTDKYTEMDYIGIQVRLMLLRKFFVGGKNPEKVNIVKIIQSAKEEFPNAVDKLDCILREFNEIELEKIEHLLTDGTKLNLYDTIEDTVYGLYLHADENRIIRLKKTTEGIRFVCIRKYVIEVEEIVLKVYNILKECELSSEFCESGNRSAMIYLGDAQNNTQGVKKSPFWENVYGHDATHEDIISCVNQITYDEQKILLFCMAFVEELGKSQLSKRVLRKYVHPMTLFDWGDFKKAQEFYKNIPNPGFSTKVRYNEAGDTAYVRFFPNVNAAFYLDTPHVFDNVYEIALGKWFGEWKIYSIGGHLESIYVKK